MITDSFSENSVAGAAGVKNMLSFEVEDIFHAESHDIESIEIKSRIIPNLIHLLDHLDDQKATATFFVLGPVACPIARIKGKLRWHLLIKAPGHRELRSVLDAAGDGLMGTSKVAVAVDVDALAML